MAYPDFTGRVFGMLLVVGRAERRPPHRQWLCKCDCGNTLIARSSDLTKGHCQSCGCRRGGVRHGHARTKPSPEYMAWRSMKSRCFSPSNSNYPRYGGRGIRVCERWQAFENFLADMGARPKGKTLERRNNNGNYELSNCYWATPKQQSNNTRKTLFLEFNGERKSLGTWAEEKGISLKNLRNRIKYGWPAEKALHHPVRKKRAA